MNNNFKVKKSKNGYKVFVEAPKEKIVVCVCADSQKAQNIANILNSYTSLKTLFLKYIAHIQLKNGSDLITLGEGDPEGNQDITADEWAELKSMALVVDDIIKSKTPEIIT